MGLIVSILIALISVIDPTQGRGLTIDPTQGKVVSAIDPTQGTGNLVIDPTQGK